MRQYTKTEIKSFGRNPFRGLSPMTYRRIASRCKSYYFFLRLRNGLATYDEKRLFLINCSTQ